MKIIFLTFVECYPGSNYNDVMAALDPTTFWRNNRLHSLKFNYKSNDNVSGRFSPEIYLITQLISHWVLD